MEVMPGIRKFMIDCNWKFAVDNVFDFYHAQVTHMSAYASGLFGSEQVRADLVVDSGGGSTPDGATFDFSNQTGGGAIDSVVVLGEYGHAIGGPAISGGVTLMDQSWRQTPQAKEALGPAGMNVAGHPNIFPNSWITLNQELAVRIPRGPLSTEIWVFSFVDRSASPEAQEMQRFMANHIFGPSGFLEQEDGENFAQSSMRTTGHASRQIPQLLKMNLGRGKVVKEHGLARIDGTISEHAQLWTYASWVQWMKGGSWDELKSKTIPGDYL
jgi:3-phenylpropionate/trans-cinnamate dioxygenase alpha subunit